jgi:hypothetical protein
MGCGVIRDVSLMLHIIGPILDVYYNYFAMTILDQVSNFLDTCTNKRLKKILCLIQAGLKV